MRKLTMIGATLALWLSLGATHAAVFTVTSTADTDGTTCGNPCTLRQAINAANASVGVPDTINFGVSGTITVGSVLPIITDTLAIDGTGRSVTLSGGGTSQVLQLDGATSLALKSLTIANGRATQNFAAGGGVTVLGPTPSNPAGRATLSITDCVFSANSANGSFSAGAITMFFVTTSLTVDNSSFIGNLGTPLQIPSVGAILADSGVSITVSNSTFENNSGQTGAIQNTSGSLTVSGSTFTGNAGILSGGAIGVVNSAGFANTITNSTFYANSSAHQGGAIRSVGAFDIPGRLTVTNSTFSGNLSNSGNVAGENGAIFATGARHFALRNTIVEKSTNGNCGAQVFDDEGGNLSDDATCAFTTATSLANTPAQLGPLQNNGGPTRTMAPLTGSPAIDLGVNQLAIDAGLTTDQRGTGFPRISPTGGTVDRGAFEVQADNVPPSCTATAKPKTLFDANHKLVNITTKVAAFDNKPGVSFTLRAVTSSEADGGLGRNDAPLDIQGWTLGSADLTGQLRAERFSKAGRTYTITYEAKDVAGNVATCSATVTVPR